MPGSRGPSRRTPPAQGKTETRPLGAQLLPNASTCPAVVKVTNRKSDRPRSGATCADDVLIDAHTGGEQAAAKPAVLGRGSLRVLLLWYFLHFFSRELEIM